MPPLGFDALLAHNAHRLADCFRGASCSRLSGTERGPVHRPARRGGQGDCADGPAGDAAARRRPARRRGLRVGRADQRFHPAGAARRRAGDREDRRLDPVRRHQPVHRGALLGQPSRARSRQRAAARQRQHPRQRELHLRHRHAARSPQRLPLPDQPARRAARHDGHRRSAELGVERHLVREDRPLRARLDDGGGDSVQVAALSRQRRAGVGHQPAAAGEVEERDLVPLAGARGARRRRRQPHGVGGDAGRPRDAGAVEEHRAEAVRRVVADDRSERRRCRSTTTRKATPASTSSTG